MVDAVLVTRFTRLKLIFGLDPLVHHLHADSLVLVLAILLLLVLVDVDAVLGDVSHLYTGGVGEHAEVLQQPGPDLVHVLRRVLIAHVAGGDVELEVGSEVLEIVIVGQLVGDLLVQGHGRLVGPAAGDVPDGVTSSSQQHQWQVVPDNKHEKLENTSANMKMIIGCSDERRETYLFMNSTHLA